MRFRDYAFLGTTQSLCPECLRLVPAKIISRAKRVYFLKSCPTHGQREDFVCSDVRWFDQMQYSLPGKLPEQFRVEPDQGCPFDCGLCSEHEQHTCIGVLEITSSCNLSCPMCYAESGPGGNHLSLQDCCTAMDHLVRAEGRAEVLQLSGGEPTVHPDFVEIFEAACDRDIDIVMINTNGLRFATDPGLVDALAQKKTRCEVYFQLDALRDDVHGYLRGESLLETKLKAIDALGEAGLRVILVSTVQPGVNDQELGRLVEFGTQRRHITGVSFQPATYVGRHVLPELLDNRITFPDIFRLLEEQTSTWKTTDFMPLPCAHPNAHSLAYAYRSSTSTTPLARFINVDEHLDLLANGITFNRSRARDLISIVMAREACGGACSCGPLGDHLEGVDTPHLSGATVDSSIATEFMTRALEEDLSPADVFRITTTSFMDAYNFDVRQLMKSCVHHILPTGHIIPFSAYNLFYRNKIVPLPPLTDSGRKPRITTNTLHVRP